MLQSVADALFQSLRASFPPQRSYGPADLDQPALPAAAAHFLKRVLRRRLELEDEHLHAARSAWFDHDAPAVRQAYDALLHALEAHARFPPDEWEPALRQATEHVTAYLVRPVDALVAFVYRPGEEHLPAADVLRRMSYFAAYPYLREAVSVYVRQKQEASLGRDRFAALLRHVDQQFAQEYQAADWVRLLQPLFAWAQALPQPGVPAALLQDFFEAKQAGAPRQALAALPPAEPLTAADLEALLGQPGARPPAARQAPPAEAAGAVPLWQRYAQPPGGPAPPAPSSPQPAAGVPLWQQYARPIEAPPRASSPPPLRSPAPSPAPPEAPAPAPVAASAPPSSSGLAPLERAVLGEVPARNRALFVRHLFGGDLDDYERVLHLLAGAPSWQMASQIIGREIFRQHQVNIYSDAAVAFTDAVQARYQ